jgi:murein DD-endopeptidase MepM/ murein hydrolase activator NlpD
MGLLARVCDELAKESVELLYPFVAVNQTEDHKPIPFPADQLRRLRAAHPGKLKAPLLKVDWATETRGTTGDLVRALRDCAAADTGFLLWHYEGVFHEDHDRFDRRAIVEALGGRWDAVSSYYTSRHTVAPTKGDPQDTARVLKRFQADPRHMHQEVAALGEGAVDGLVRILEDQKLDSLPRFRAALILGDIRSKRALEPLRKALQDPDYNVRRCAALALGRMGDVASRPALEKLAKDDPVAWKHPDTGKVEYLVREYAAQALEMLSGRTPTPAPAPQKQQEMFLENASKMPAAPAGWQGALLPWPFPGGFREQNIWNNYTQALDFYIHGGLDFLQQPGAEVRAVAEGYVAAVATNYPQWKTHHFFIVTSRKDGNEGWCYTHVDPDSYTFKPGDRIRQGQVLGKLVDFYVGKNKGVDHLHLNYVRFHRTAPGKVVAEPLFDPLLAFDWRDSVAPQIHAPLRFVKKDTLAEFPADQEGVPRVSGRVEIIAGFSDAGCVERPCVWMVSVITLEISGERARPWRKLVLDQRGPIADVRAAGALYLTSAEAKRWTVSPYPRVFFAKVTSTEGDGTIEAADRAQAWDTTETDAQGQPRFPDGTYTVTVRAWDLQGNPAMRTAAVRVANRAAP